MFAGDVADPSTGRWAAPGSRAGARLGAALAAATAATVHLLATHETWQQARYLGVVFVLLAATCAVVAVRLAVCDARWLWEACGLIGVLVIAGYAWSRTMGLPGLQGEIGH